MFEVATVLMTINTKDAVTNKGLCVYLCLRYNISTNTETIVYATLLLPQ